MGPQHDSCGRALMLGGFAVWALTLQWGRNMIVAEGCNDVRNQLTAVASMGPQHDSCGRLLLAEAMKVMDTASMGPQHDSCGRVAMSRRRSFTRLTLQWGRNMIVAEGPVFDAPGPDALTASMGPQHDSCGRDLVLLGFGRHVDASMGPQHDSCGRNSAASV